MHWGFSMNESVKKNPCSLGAYILAVGRLTDKIRWMSNSVKFCWGKSFRKWGKGVFEVGLELLLKYTGQKPLIYAGN